MHICQPDCNARHNMSPLPGCVLSACLIKALSFACPIRRQGRVEVIAPNRKELWLESRCQWQQNPLAGR